MCVGVCDRWGVILECCVPLREPWRHHPERMLSSTLLMEEASSLGYEMCICKVKTQSG